MFLNVPLEQDGVSNTRIVTIYLTNSDLVQSWRLTGMCGGKNYSITFPQLVAQVDFTGNSNELRITCNGTYSYQDSNVGTGNWARGSVLFVPSSVTFSSGEYGTKTFNATGSTLR